MDFILISMDERVCDGLRDVLQDCLGDHDYVRGFVPIEMAMLIARIARSAPDLASYFPKGKWATIQVIEGRIDDELSKLTWKSLENS